MPRLTECQFLEKMYRGLAAYHTAHGGLARVDLSTLRATSQLGVPLEPPATRTAGELTVAQCRNYADQLQKIDAKRGAT